MIQATYHNTGLTPDDVNDAYKAGKLRDFCKAPLAHEKSPQVMLYPLQYPKAKIQVQRYVVNIWCSDFDQLNEIEKIVNGIFGRSSNPNPLRGGKINPRISGEPCITKILETPLGFIAAFAYRHPDIIAEAVKQNTDLFYRRIQGCEDP